MGLAELSTAELDSLKSIIYCDFYIKNTKLFKENLIEFCHEQFVYYERTITDNYLKMSADKIREIIYRMQNRRNN